MAYEDFTTYTEFDEGSAVTVDSATKVSWASLKTRNETSYLYKDKGVNYFAGDFTHKFEIQFSPMGDIAWSNHWMLSNTVGDTQDVMDASADAYALFSYDNTEAIYLRLFESGSMVDDSWAAPGPQSSTIYYIEIVRDDDGGANSTGRVTAYIRTGSHSGVLRDTLVVDCSVGEQNNFRYIYGLATSDKNDFEEGLATGFTQNLDIGEAVGWTGKISGVSSPAKVCGVAAANITSVMGIS